MRWNRICDGWATRVLSFWPVGGVATFWPFWVLSFCAGAFLVLLLCVHHYVLLAQLFLQVVILLGETFHCCCEGLNLPLHGNGPQFVALIIGGGCHWTSEYHATFCLGSGKYGLSTDCVPTDDTNWWCRNKESPISHMVLTFWKQYLRNTKKEDLIESIGVVPAKYPPKVKLELLTTLECQS